MKKKTIFDHVCLCFWVQGRYSLFESAVDVALVICILLQFNVDVCGTTWFLMGLFTSFVDIDSLFNRKQIKDN